MKMRYKKFKLNYLAKPNSLKCTCCGNYYDAWWAKDQASNCACHFFQYDNVWYIYGGYPSNFDDSKFVVTNVDIIQERHKIAFANRENTKDQWGHYDDSKLAVCDTCIRQFLSTHYIQEDKSYNPFAAIDELISFYHENPEKYFEFMSEGPNLCMQLIRDYRAQTTLKQSL